MTDKEKIRAYVKRLQKPKGHGDYWKGYDSALNDILSFIDSLQEEPVSEDLKEAAIEYCDGNKGSDARVRAGFVMGAKWQKEHELHELNELNKRNYERT